MTVKRAARVRARALRAEGLTYDEIARAVGVSKSSVSLWTRDLPRPGPSPEGVARRVAAHREAYRRRRLATDAMKAEQKETWCALVGQLTERELLIAGAVAYWAEGSKTKPWRPDEKVSLINSDPDVVRLWLRYLAVCGVSTDRLAVTVNIHVTADVAAAEAYWSEVTGIPRETFLKPVLKRNIVPTVRKNVNADYHGCLAIRVRRGAELYRRIEGTWWAVARAVRP